MRPAEDVGFAGLENFHEFQPLGTGFNLQTTAQVPVKCITCAQHWKGTFFAKSQSISPGGKTMKGILVLVILPLLVLPACSRTSAGVDPKAIEAKYGLTGAYIDDITTEDGKIKATIVPTTLEDGRKVQLIIPHERVDPEHQVFMRDGITITPMELSDPKVPRQTFVQSQPRVVERRPAVSHSKKRPWEKEVLIVGGSAGAGAAIGAAAGGGKGAGIGALSGGVAGLVYDLATRNKK